MKWSATLVLIAVIFFAGINFSVGRTYAGEQAQAKEPVPDGAKDLEEKWGIKILSIRLTAGGYMLDFRYRVIDADKAAPLFDGKIKPYLVDLKSGAKCQVPESSKIGALRQTRKPFANHNYFIMFANPGKLIKKENAVTIVVGDFRAENLTVQ